MEFGYTEIGVLILVALIALVVVVVYTDEQLAALDHNTFANLYVHFEFAHTPPDQTPRLEAKKTRPVRKKTTKARA